MSLFEALKKLFKKDKEDKFILKDNFEPIVEPLSIANNTQSTLNQQQTSLNQQQTGFNQQQTPVNQQQTPVNQQQTPVNQQQTPANQQQTLSQSTVQQFQQDPTLVIEHQKPKIEVVNTTSAIENWEKTIQAVQQHPLSQVKIINTQILEDLSSVLKSMDLKLNNLEKLDKIDEIYEILIKTQLELESQGIKSEHLNSALAEIERLTIKDKDVIDWISRQEQVTAQNLADRINLSRSTASFRLNRLEELGVLEKVSIGKKIYYKIKNLPVSKEAESKDKREYIEQSINQANTGKFN